MSHGPSSISSAHAPAKTQPPRKHAHPHAWFLRELADGAEVEEFEIHHTDWEPNDYSQFVRPENPTNEVHTLTLVGSLMLHPEVWKVRRRCQAQK